MNIIKNKILAGAGVPVFERYHVCQKCGAKLGFDKPLTGRVQFIRFDGGYPTLCFGAVTLKIDNIVKVFKKPFLIAPGEQKCGQFEADGFWKIATNDELHALYKIYNHDSEEIPTYPPELRDEIVRVVNENIPRGCCGGCL